MQTNHARSSSTHHNSFGEKQKKPQKSGGKKIFTEDLVTEKLPLLPSVSCNSLEEISKIFHLPSTSAASYQSFKTTTTLNTNKFSYGSIENMPFTQNNIPTSENSFFELINENGQIGNNQESDRRISSNAEDTASIQMENLYSDKIVLNDETLHIYGYKKCQIKLVCIKY